MADTEWHSAGPGRYTHSLSSSLTTCHIFNSSDPSSQISPQPRDPVSSSSPCSVQIPQENRQVTAIMFYNCLKARNSVPAVLIHSLLLGKRESLRPSRCPAAHDLSADRGNNFGFDLMWHKVYKWRQLPALAHSSILAHACGWSTELGLSAASIHQEQGLKIKIPLCCGFFELSSDNESFKAWGNEAGSVKEAAFNQASRFSGRIPGTRITCTCFEGPALVLSPPLTVLPGMSRTAPPDWSSAKHMGKLYSICLCSLTLPPQDYLPVPHGLTWRWGWMESSQKIQMKWQLPAPRNEVRSGEATRGLSPHRGSRFHWVEETKPHGSIKLLTSHWQKAVTKAALLQPHRMSQDVQSPAFSLLTGLKIHIFFTAFISFWLLPVCDPKHFAVYLKLIFSWGCVENTLPFWQ